tara:strand:+ start:1161 stop:1343 length:183 start_codon:yes stop_codon:yes gene_type:complete
MMTLVKLKPDVVEFLEDNVWKQEEAGVMSFIINEMVYSETDEKNVYMVSVLDASVDVGLT